MKIGVHVPQWGPDANREGVLRVARRAEQAGLDSVWVADHIVYPLHSESRYPYRSDGAPFAPEDGFLDAFTTLAAIAGATDRIALGTSVLVLPMRDPLEVAKSVATLDVLSGGRVIVGIGAGWWREEFEALGAQFRGRGARMDEQIAILRALWRDGGLSAHSGHYNYRELVCRPQPMQPGGPPILVGGMGPTARRRAALLGDGWHALGSHEQTLTDGYADVVRIAREAGRNEAAVSLSTSAGLPADPASAVRRLERFARAGIGHVILNVAGNTAEAICAGIERLQEEILPELSTVLAAGIGSARAS
jgi:probable F420-dependent oxidoreductase